MGTFPDRSFTEQLPLNGRRYNDFTSLIPNSSYDGRHRTGGHSRKKAGRIPGTPTEIEATPLVDGTDATNNDFAVGCYCTPYYLYGEEAIEEFQVPAILGLLWRRHRIRQRGNTVWQQCVSRQRVLQQLGRPERMMPSRKRPGFQSRKMLSYRKIHLVAGHLRWRFRWPCYKFQARFALCPSLQTRPRRSR